VKVDVNEALEARSPKAFYRIKFIKITPFTVEGKESG
jgi:hypothetical protein